MQKAKSERAEREMECGQMDRNRDKKTRRAGQWDKQGEGKERGWGARGSTRANVIQMTHIKFITAQGAAQ